MHIQLVTCVKLYKIDCVVLTHACFVLNFTNPHTLLALGQVHPKKWGGASPCLGGDVCVYVLYVSY